MKNVKCTKGVSSKCFALLISILMVVAMLPSIALAGEEQSSVAKVGSNSYQTLTEAISKAQSGDTITLQDDVELDDTLNLEKDVTLDLNGHKISNGGKLGQNYLIVIKAESVVTIKGDKDGSQIADSRTDVEGQITAIRVLGKLTVDGSNLNISRGSGIAVKVDEDKTQGELIVNDGTIQSDTQALQNWGITVINGGTFKGIVDSYSYSNVGGTITVNEGAFEGELFAAQLKYGGNWPTVSAKIDIKGGTFNEKISEYYDDGTNGVQPIERLENKPDGIVESEVNITNGIFAKDPSAYVDATKEVAYNMAKEAYEIYTIDGRQGVNVTHAGTVTTYDALDDAIKAAQAGDTITLVKDIAVNAKNYNANNRLNVNEDNITIDLNGKTLTAPNCTLTLCGDGIILKNGNMVATTTAAGQTYGSYVAQIKGKNIVVNGVTTIGGFNVAGYNSDNPDTPDTTATITNCDITATNYYTVCSQRNSEATIKNSTLTYGNYAYFWLEKEKYKEGDADPANVDAKLFYEKDTVTFKDPNKTLYNTGGVAPIAFYTVTVDPFNGDDATIKTVKVGDALSFKTLGEPTRDGYTFTGWYNDNTKLTEDITPTGNMDIVAHWEKNKSSEDTKVDTNTVTKTETNDEDGSTTTTTTETVKETAKDGSTTETVTEDVVKTNTDGTKEKVNTATETKTDKSGAVTETKSETVTKTDATGKVTETVETKADTKTTTENNKTTEAKTETVTTKDADGNVTETVKTEATVETTKTLTTKEQVVTTTDKDGVAVVETTKNVEDKTNNVAIETKLSNNTAKTEAKIAQDGETLPTIMTVDATATKAKADAATTEVTKTEVTLSKETVAAIKEAAAAIDYTKVETVELKTDVATLEIDNTALQTLTGSADDSQSLLLKVAKTDSTVEETKNATATFELTAALVDGEGHETKVFNDIDAANNGTIKVNVAYEPEKADNTIEVYYVAEDGEKTKMDASYKDGVLSWDTNHFSTYEVVETAKAEPTPDPDDNNDNNDKNNNGGNTDSDNNGGNGSSNGTQTADNSSVNSQSSDSTSATGDDFNIMPLIALILISGGAVAGIAFTSKRRRNS